MDLHSTPLFPTRGRNRRQLAQPSDSVIEFLKNFARSYSPGLDVPARKTAELLN